MNGLQQLSETEKQATWKRLTKDWRHTRIVMLAHDGNVTSLARFMNMVPE